MSIWCASLESGIRSYGDFCVAPNKRGCSPPDGSYLIFTKKDGTACNATDQIFLLDQDGVIYHKCSTKKVCPQGNNFLVLHCTLSVVVSGIIYLFMNGIWIVIDYFRSQLSSFLFLFLFFTSYDHRQNFRVMLLHFSVNTNIPELLHPFQAWPIKILLSRGWITLHVYQHF